MPTLHMSKARHREVNNLPVVTKPVSNGATIQRFKPCSPTSEPALLILMITPTCAGQSGPLNHSPEIGFIISIMQENTEAQRN